MRDLFLALLLLYYADGDVNRQMIYPGPNNVRVQFSVREAPNFRSLCELLKIHPMTIPKSELKTLAEGILKLYN